MRCHSSLPQKKPSEMKAEEVIEFVSSVEDLNDRENVSRAFKENAILGAELLSWKQQRIAKEYRINLLDAGRILHELRNRERPEPKRIVVKYSENHLENLIFESQQDLEKFLHRQGAGSMRNGDNEEVIKLSDLKQGKTYTLSFAEVSLKTQVKHNTNTIQNMQNGAERKGIEGARKLLEKEHPKLEEYSISTDKSNVSVPDAVFVGADVIFPVEVKTSIESSGVVDSVIGQLSKHFSRCEAELGRREEITLVLVVMNSIENHILREIVKGCGRPLRVIGESNDGFEYLEL